jgi:hypothetical protein
MESNTASGWISTQPIRNAIERLLKRTSPRTAERALPNDQSPSAPAESFATTRGPSLTIAGYFAIQKACFERNLEHRTIVAYSTGFQ